MSGIDFSQEWRKLSWAQQQRLTWINEVIDIFGSINRRHLQRKFRISTPQASVDFQLFQTLFPGVMKYDTQEKKYFNAALLPDEPF
jgi:hypothetical protein